MFQGRSDGNRRHAAHGAQRAVHHGVAQVVQQGHLLRLVVVGADLVDHLHAARRPNATRRAFAARFERTELHGVARQLRQVGLVVVHHDAAVAEACAHGGVGLVVERNIPLRLRQIGAQRPAHLHRLDGPARGRATAVVIEELPQRQAKSRLHQPAVQDVARQLKRQRAMRAAHAKVAVKLRAPRQDDGHAGQCDDVVDDSGLAKQTGQRGQRRLGAHDAAFAFEAL